MPELTPLQKQMRKELQDESLFAQVQGYGLRYLDEAFERHVFPKATDLPKLNQFEEPLPQHLGEARQILEDLHNWGSPNAVTHIGGRYFGFVNGSIVPTGLLAKLLASFWDQNTAMQVISPISSKLEEIVEQWLIDLLGLPSTSKAGFVSGTSMANFCGLAAARYRILMHQGWDVSEKGLFGAPPIRVITGRQAHSTILKAISLNGLGKGNIEWVAVDNQGRIRADEVPELDSSCLLILQAGDVNSGSFDDFQSLGQKAQDAGAWVHIDGAFGLWAGATQSLKHLTQGIELANSWALDGHKTLNTPYDSGIILCADPEAMVSALHMSGSYIILGDKRDGMFYTPEMSRRSRVIELWATLKYLGREGLESMINTMHERARQFAGEISQLEGFEVLNDVVFNQVLIRCPSDAITEQTLKHVQELRECWAGGSLWEGKKVIRISVCSWATTSEDISRSVASFAQAYALVMAEKHKV